MACSEARDRVVCEIDDMEGRSTSWTSGRRRKANEKWVKLLDTLVQLGMALFDFRGECDVGEIRWPLFHLTEILVRFLSWPDLPRTFTNSCH